MKLFSSSNGLSEEVNLRSNKITAAVKQIGPWIAAAGILTYEFYHIDYLLFFDSLKRAELSVYIPLVLFFIFLWLFIETFNLRKLYSYFGHSITYIEFLKIRGATFLLMIINYGLGMGGIAMYIKKMHGVPLTRSTGIFFYYMIVESSAMAMLAVAGFFLSGESSGIQNWVLLLGFALFIFYLSEVVILKYVPPIGFLKKIVENRFVKPFKESTWSIYAGIFFQRTLYFMTFIVFFFFAVKAFHMNIPLYTLTALVPIIFFIGNLPITPFGLGTIQAAMLYFFKDYGSDANILALSLLYSISILLFRSFIGIFFLRFITKENYFNENNMKEDDPGTTSAVQRMVF